MNRRLYRSPEDRVLAGVAGGMAETYDLDPAIVRVGWALLALLTGGVFLVIYIVMALVVPLRPANMPLWSAAAAPGAPNSPGPGYDQQMGFAQSSGPDGGPDMASGPTGGAVPPGPGAPLGSPPGSPYYYPSRRHRGDATGAIVIGSILILVGAYFLLRQFIPAFNFSLIWPIVVIGGGILLILAAFARPRRQP